MKRPVIFSVLFVLRAICAYSQPDTYIPDGTIGHIYKVVDGVDMHLWEYKPEIAVIPGKNTSIVFFFGGGWLTGSVKKFEPQAKYLASRGMNVFLAEYRTKQSAGTDNPSNSVADAKSAMRYIRSHAAELGIDPDRIVASGGSAGGHLAAATAYLTSFDDEADDLSVSPAPDVLVLFNPVIDNSPGGFGHKRVREYWRKFSPMHNINSSNVRPTLFMTGSLDRLIPVATAEKYAALTRNAGARCDLEIYDGARHGFFDYTRRTEDKKNYYRITLRRLDDFLVSMGYLPRSDE